MRENRYIIHIDLDAFYASVEQRDQPALRGKPVIVGGSPERRGVVSTASYEARAYGVHSAMPCRTAQRLCPEAIFLPPRFDVYKAVSQQVMAIFRAHTNVVEPLSLDEAYIDVSDVVYDLEEATQLARTIKQQIRDKTELTASAGVSFSKSLAKAASDAHKPDGLTVISLQQAPAFLDALPVDKFLGVGKVTAARLRQASKPEQTSSAWAKSGCVRCWENTEVTSTAWLAVKMIGPSSRRESANLSARRSRSNVISSIEAAWKRSWSAWPGK